MSFRSRFVFFAIWVASIVAAAGAWGYAQTPAPATTVVSGPDLGFRVDRHDGQTPIGVFVIKENGQWVEVRESVGPRRVTSR
jgi:hypothetical protein